MTLSRVGQQAIFYSIECVTGIHHRFVQEIELGRWDDVLLVYQWGAPVGAGAVYGPAGTISANVIVVSGSAMDFRVPQGVAANKPLTKTGMAGSIMMGSSRERAG
jgi:hypothetical protein